MSDQKFSDYERLAFWEVYDNKCLYCKKAIADIDQMNIDHLIPEKISADKLEKAKKLYGLPSDFAVDLYRNLVSAHYTCNNLKSDLFASEIHSGLTQIYLQKAELKAVRLEKELEKLKGQDVLSKFKMYARSGLRKGVVTHGDLEKTIADLKLEFPMNLTTTMSASSLLVSSVLPDADAATQTLTPSSPWWSKAAAPGSDITKGKQPFRRHGKGK